MGLSNDVKSRAKKQVEFYFSDSNVPRDNFLRSKIDEDPEGFVDLSLVCSFSRMCELLGILKGSKDVTIQVVKEVAEVLRSSDSLTVSEDGKRVRRSQPITSLEDAAKAVDARSLYAAPFPYNATLDSITGFFNSAAAPVNCVRMRRHVVSKDFRGSVFVEFPSEEAAKEVLQKSLEYEGAQLKLEPKADFLQRKINERKGKAENAQADAEDSDDADGAAQKTGASAKEAAGKSDAQAARDADTSEAQAAGSGGEDINMADRAGSGAAEADAAEATGQPEATLPAPDQDPQFEQGRLVRIDFGEAEHELGFGDIRSAFDGIAYVEFQKGGSSGIIRFQGKDHADKALAQTEESGKVSISGVAAGLKRLEGDEEVDFYKRLEAAKKNNERAGSSGGGRGRGRKRGFQGGGRGRGGRGFKRGRR